MEMKDLKKTKNGFQLLTAKRNIIRKAKSLIAV